MRRDFSIAQFVLLSIITCLPLATNAEDSIRGMIALGTWATQAEFKDVVVTKDGQTLFSSDFSRGMQGWKTIRGNWEVIDGALRQTGDGENARIFVGQSEWSDYTLALKARKLSGDEGFLISFGVTDPAIKSWWNIGGWGNSRHAIEAPGLQTEGVAGQIETGRWYDIRIELKGNSVKAFLDGKLIHEATRVPPRRYSSRALIPDLIADPSITEIDGTFYLNATTDGAGAGLSTSGLPVVWKSKDGLNWSFSGSIFSENYDAKFWAPSGMIQRNGKYYLFPTLDNKITALVADSPEGPFRSLDGKEINKTSGWKPFPIKVGNPIDADVFIDDDGTAYMLWSQRGIGKLKPDFSGFDGEQTLIKTKRGGYSEGPCLLKRNGIYYYLYTLEGNENYKYAYMMSRTSPLGPWEAPQNDIIASTDRDADVFGPGHGCFFNPKGSDQWYFAYLEYGLGGTNRQVHVDKMNFNADGTIQPIKLTKEGVGAIRSVGDDKPNLAIGKQATASSSAPDYPVPSGPQLNRYESFDPTNAIDDANGTRWLAAAEDSSPWFQLDLGEERDIHRTELYFIKPTAGHAYRLEISSDEKSWTSYGGQDEQRIQSPQVDEKPARARYLRVSILRGTGGLWEFRVR